MKTSTPHLEGISETDVSTPGFAPGSKIDRRQSIELSPAQTVPNSVAFDHSRVLLPHFVFAASDTPISQLYRLSLDEGEPRAPAGFLTRVWARLAFAFVALRQAWIYLRRYGAFVRKKYGIAKRRQFADLWYIAWHQNQSPRHYYWRKLYHIPDRADWPCFLEHRQVNTLLDHLNRRLPITEATNKVRFHDHCVAHQLPTAPLLASWNAQGQPVGTLPSPLAADLFLKPTSEFGSVGILPIIFDPTTGTHRLNGENHAWSPLLEAIGQLAKASHRPMLLQRRLFNASRNAIYGNLDICNVRIVTGLAPGGIPQPISGFIRLPSSLTTTGHDRNIMIASIDLATGRMEPGRFRETMLGDFPVHPDTGAPIENRILLGWQDMIALAIRGHRTYPWIPFIGWDIVDTQDGLLLLEANTYWGGDCVQLPGATPLGHTKFPEIYLKCFEHFYGKDAPALQPIR